MNIFAICQPNSFGLCSQCKEKIPPGKVKTCPTFLQINKPKPLPKGVGTAIANVLSGIGIKKCGGCQKREEILNTAGNEVIDFLKHPFASLSKAKRHKALQGKELSLPFQEIMDPQTIKDQRKEAVLAAQKAWKS